jgi:hypothetical protein
MITMYRKDGATSDSQEVELRGLSTDTKPTTSVANGTTFIEIDTGKIYMYDLENKEWKEL